jgi:hypothetical protein
MARRGYNASYESDVPDIMFRTKHYFHFANRDRRKANRNRRKANRNRRKANRNRRKANRNRRKANRDRRKANRNRRKVNVRGSVVRGARQFYCDSS